MTKARLQFNDETALHVLLSSWLIPQCEGGAGDVSILRKREFIAGSHPAPLQIPHKETELRGTEETLEN